MTMELITRLQHPQESLFLELPTFVLIALRTVLKKEFSQEPLNYLAIKLESDLGTRCVQLMLMETTTMTLLLELHFILKANR